MPFFSNASSMTLPKRLYSAAELLLGGLALMAGELALSAREPARAALALTEAERQYAAAGPGAKLAVVRSMLAGLGALT